MPYAPEHKERSRSRIVECARRMFNRYGFEAVSIDQIMANAGLTRGGFYHHFANKEELSSEAIAGYAGCTAMDSARRRGGSSCRWSTPICRASISRTSSDSAR